MKLSKALQVREVGQLKQSGSFRGLKAGLEEQLHATLRANSWLALFERLSWLRERGHHVSEQALGLVNQQQYGAAKRQLQALGLDLPSAAPEALEAVCLALKRHVLPDNRSDAYARFEKNKLRNFRHSSRLEGIELKAPDKDITVEDVVLRLKR